MKFEGYGYEWDADLIDGPCDGLTDRAVQLHGEEPPEFLVKILGRPMRHSKIGEKVMEDWEALKTEGKVAVYKLKEFNDEEDTCKYQHVETMLAKDYKTKYVIHNQ